MREVILDLETTGLNRNKQDVAKGHRVIEVGCVELFDSSRIGRHFHSYVNPLRPISKGAVKIHGISDEFVSDKPKFEDIAEDLFSFIGDSPIVIHNARFDTAFLDEEIHRLRNQPQKDFYVVDTLEIARRKFPGAKNDLNSLAAHYGVSIPRDKHGALVDAYILAHIYPRLI
jgi:DNA polymerase-3 subunit epsilon